MKKEITSFLKDKFNGLEIRKPLFYSWKFGLRFDLETKYENEEEYFDNVYKRSKQIFDTIFNPDDEIFLMYFKYKWRKQKIKRSNSIFKHINELCESDIEIDTIKGHYDEEKSDKWNRAIIRTKIKNIDIDFILKAISNLDFYHRKPRLDNGGYSRNEVFFVCINKQLIFNMYDDRGLDVIATDKEILKPIYNNHIDWILDYDRAQMEKIMK